MRNIGPVSRAWLAEAGVHTLADLRHCGAVATFRMIRDRQSGASLNLLWALEGAVRDCDWRALTEADKSRLREAVRTLDRGG